MEGSEFKNTTVFSHLERCFPLNGETAIWMGRWCDDDDGQVGARQGQAVAQLGRDLHFPTSKQVFTTLMKKTGANCYLCAYVLLLP